jgi:hypothetical protein
LRRKYRAESQQKDEQSHLINPVGQVWGLAKQSKQP